MESRDERCGASPLAGRSTPKVQFCTLRYRDCQRATAAFRAASLRSAGVIFAARAFPPLSPPLRPSATAAGSFPSAGSYLGSAPVASSTSCLASALGSVGRLRERSGIASQDTSHGFPQLSQTVECVVWPAVTVVV